MRLNRFLSLCGLGSRRGCEELILSGRVSVNNRQIKDLATTVEDKDVVSVDGQAVKPKRTVVIALNKPKGFLCTKDDPQKRPTIFDLLPAKHQNLHHVGRLDQDSEGLILLTNDGELSQRLAHPSSGVEKEYEVRTEQKFEPEKLPQLIKGLNTKEGFARAERAWLENPWTLHMILKQGLKRQIREMLFMLGHEVERLVRIRIGGLWLKGLAKGAIRELSPTEVEQFFQKRASKPRTIGKPGTKPFDDADDHFAVTVTKAVKPEQPVKPRPSKPSKAGGPRGFEHEAPLVEADEPFEVTKRPSVKKTSQKHRPHRDGGQRSKFTEKRFGGRKSKW